MQNTYRIYVKIHAIYFHKVSTTGVDDKLQQLTATLKRKQQLRRNQQRAVRSEKNTVSKVHNLL